MCNALAAISCAKRGVDYRNDGMIDCYGALIICAQDYYPFGMLMPGRKFSAGTGYRYGFNGKENDNEVKGEGAQQDYGMRIYDPRLGKFLSVDPLTKDYPAWSPYPFAMNRPIDGSDLDGAEWEQKTTLYTDGWKVTEFRVQLKVKNASTILTDNQVWAMATALKSGIETTFRKRFDSKKHEFKIDVTINRDNSAVEGRDFYLNFKDQTSTTGGYVAGQATGGIGKSNINQIDISGTLNGRILPTPVRTGAHELGHTAGLEHPHQPHGNKLDPTTKQRYKQGEIPGNLMIQGIMGGHDDNVTYTQFQSMIGNIHSQNITLAGYKSIIRPTYNPQMPAKDNATVRLPGLAPVYTTNSKSKFVLSNQPYVKKKP